MRGFHRPERRPTVRSKGKRRCERCCSLLRSNNFSKHCDPCRKTLAEINATSAVARSPYHPGRTIRHVHVMACK